MLSSFAFALVSLLFAFIYTHYVHWTLYTLLLANWHQCHLPLQCIDVVLPARTHIQTNRINFMCSSRNSLRTRTALDSHWRKHLLTFSNVPTRLSFPILFELKCGNRKIWNTECQWKGKYFRLEFYVLYQFVLLVSSSSFIFSFFFFEVFVCEMTRSGYFVNCLMRACGQRSVSCFYNPIPNEFGGWWWKCVLAFLHLPMMNTCDEYFSNYFDIV